LTSEIVQRVKMLKNVFLVPTRLSSTSINFCELLAENWNYSAQINTIESSRLAASFWGISRLGCAFVFCGNDSNFHICM